MSTPEFQSAARVARRAARSVAGAARLGFEAVDRDLRAHIAQLPLVGFTQVLPTDTDVRPKADDGHPPILLVHGMGGRPGNFVLLRARLAWAGRKRVYSVSLAGAHSVDDMAARVRDKVAAVAAINALPDGARIDVVAHSLGGIVARVAVEDPGTARRVRRVVTLGTPHAGTWAARFAGTPNAVQLRPGSPLLERLERAASPVELVSILGGADVLVTPLESAALPGSRVIRLDGHTHYTLLATPAALDAVVSALDA